MQFSKQDYSVKRVFLKVVGVKSNQACGFSSILTAALQVRLTSTPSVLQDHCCSSPVASVHIRSNLHTCTVLPHGFQLCTCVHFLWNKEELGILCSLLVHYMLFWWNYSVIFISVLRLFLRTVLLCMVSFCFVVNF